MDDVGIRLAVARGCGVGDGLEAGGEGACGLRGLDGLDFEAHHLGDGFGGGSEACGGEGGDELGLLGQVVFLLGGEFEERELGLIRECLPEDAAAKLPVDALADGPCGGCTESLEALLVRIAGERAGAGLRRHRQLAAQDELEQCIIAPPRARFEGLRVVARGLEGVQFGATWNGAGALSDELLDRRIKLHRLLFRRSRRRLEEGCRDAEFVQKRIPRLHAVPLGHDQEHRRKVHRQRLAQYDRL